MISPSEFERALRRSLDELVRRPMARAMREEMFVLHKMFEAKDVALAPLAAATLPAEGGLDVSWYRTKTIKLMVDYAFQYSVELSDDGATWLPYVTHEDVPLAVDRLNVITVDEDCMRLRLSVSNPDKAAHTLAYISMLGRRI